MNKYNSNTRNWLSFLDIDQYGPIEPDITLEYIPEFIIKSLLLDTMYFNHKHAELKLVLTWKFLPHWLSFTELEASRYATGENGQSLA